MLTYSLILVADIVILLLLLAWIFPLVFLRAKKNTVPVNDRGLRSVCDGAGKSVAYEPDIMYRDIIPHYVLSDRNGEFVLRCETKKGLKYIDYDIRLFDAKGREYKVLHNREFLAGDGFTSCVPIDRDTAYVSVSVNSADGTVFPVRDSRRIPLQYYVLYFVCSFVVTLIAVYTAKMCFGRLFGGIFWEGFMYTFWGNIVSLGACVLLAVIHFLISFFAIRHRYNKKRGGAA